jgi:hypothetical protein
MAYSTMLARLPTLPVISNFSNNHTVSLRNYSYPEGLLTRATRSLIFQVPRTLCGGIFNVDIDGKLSVSSDCWG